NTILFPYALGGENKTVKMGMPIKDGVVHHGMTKIASTAQEEYAFFFDVEMKKPSDLLSDLETIDFIKCDVEGYEHVIFGHLTDLLLKHKPKIQTELGGKENREKTITLLESLGYKTYILQNNSLISADISTKKNYSSDFYFIL
ncbi:MAG: FkbM family methyltransferase, partial [Bacteroidales bacterium]